MRSWSPRVLGGLLSCVLVLTAAPTGVGHAAEPVALEFVHPTWATDWASVRLRDSSRHGSVDEQLIAHVRSTSDPLGATIKLSWSGSLFPDTWLGRFELSMTRSRRLERPDVILRVRDGDVITATVVTDSGTVTAERSWRMYPQSPDPRQVVYRRVDGEPARVVGSRGAVAPHATVRLYDDSILVASGQADGAGRFDIGFPRLPERYVVGVTSTRHDGSESEPLEVRPSPIIGRVLPPGGSAPVGGTTDVRAVGEPWGCDQYPGPCTSLAGDSLTSDGTLAVPVRSAREAGRYELITEPRDFTFGDTPSYFAEVEDPLATVDVGTIRFRPPNFHATVIDARGVPIPRAEVQVRPTQPERNVHMFIRTVWAGSDGTTGVWVPNGVHDVFATSPPGCFSRTAGPLSVTVRDGVPDIASHTFRLEGHATPVAREGAVEYVPITGQEGAVDVTLETPAGEVAIALREVTTDGMLRAGCSWTELAPDAGTVIDAPLDIDGDVTFDTGVVCLPYDAGRAALLGIPEQNLQVLRLSSGRATPLPSEVRTTKSQVCAPAGQLGLLGVGVPRSAGSAPIVRLAGADRVATAVRISQATFPDGAPVAFLASASDFPDALSAGPAAATVGAPVLLTASTTLSGATETELRRLQPRRVYLLGGRAAISAEVERRIGQLGVAVERLAGADRYATSAVVAGRFFAPGTSTVFIATGQQFADALAGGAVAGAQQAPVLLTHPARLPATVEAALGQLRPARIIVLGGTAAVSPAVEAHLRSLSIDGVTRIAGSTRFATAVELRRFAGASAGAPTSDVFVATGTTFPDALAGAAAAGQSRATILLVTREGIPRETSSELARVPPMRITVLGGTGAVSDAVVSALR